MPMDRETQLRLVKMRDDAGVLSLYVNADPRQEGSQPPWKARLEQGLKHLKDAVDEPVRGALGRRLHNLKLEIEQFVRPGAPGVGRALFVPLSNGEHFTVEMQTPLTDLVALAPRSHIGPMIAAWAEGSPAGIVVVDRKGMRILDTRFGRCEELSRLEFELDTAEWREMRGPAANRGPRLSHSAQSSSTQTDLFDFKVAEHLSKFLAAAHTTLEAHVANFGWDFLAVSGEPELVESTASALSNSLKAEIVPSKLVLGQATPVHVGEALAPELTAARRLRDERFVADFIEASTKATAGPEAVLGVLAEGRVERLLLERDSRWSGQRIPAGSVLVDGLAPVDPDIATAVAEGQLGEQMIEMALASDAAVSILMPGVELPEESGGVAAMLRW